MQNRNQNLTRLQQSAYDVLIIGGGISGAWLALHCARQGLKTALVEQDDFASKTSSASSKLLHGGIRYLQQLQFSKVRESALERAHYLYAAPHLATAIPFVVPTYPDFKRSKFFLNCGMLAYRALCVGEQTVISDRQAPLRHSHTISSKKLNSLFDFDNNDHTGAVIFPESHMYDSERAVLAVIKTAGIQGADVVNYLRVEQLTKHQDTVTGALVCDQLSKQTFTIESKLVINATGPWIDELNLAANGKTKPGITGFAIGSHIISKRQISDHAIAIATKQQSNAALDRGGRHVFIIPWRGFSLIGTSYDEMDNPNQALELRATDVRQLLDAVNEALPALDLSHKDLVSGYSGIYPLQTDNIQSSVYQGTGEYQIIDHAESDGLNGLVTALGAKFTTGRVLSAKTMYLINKKVGQSNKVEKTVLHNAQYKHFNNFLQQKSQQYAPQFTLKTMTHLLHCYGSDIDQFMTYLEQNPVYKTPIASHLPDLLGQVAWAVEHEMAINLNDILYQRTSIGHFGISNSDIQTVAGLMGELLNWNNEELNRQITQISRQRDVVDLAIQSA